ncbi:MAG: DUF3887 domain-containing protein [Mycobacterium sp.]|nr:DUF3887 domain-containing protein [Mycobacterium sp.]MBV9722691.1 DUF3887 domain-containing protein [Mycobacterium sp.]
MKTTVIRNKSTSATRGIAATAAAVAATFLALTACGSGSHGDQTNGSTTTPSTAPSTNPVQRQDNQLALQMLDAIVRGDFAAATTHFDSLMQQKLTVSGLASAWKTYQEALGNYQSHGNPQDVARGSLTVVNIPLQMAQAPGQFRVSFHNDQTVAGLYFLKAGVAVP